MRLPRVLFATVQVEKHLVAAQRMVNYINLEPEVALSVGRFSQEKIQDLGPFWANSVGLQRQGLTFATEAGLQLESKGALNDNEEQ